ncbi:MAG: bifunctional hydroxymethylpyrimidine kinase/phosphomethylpyrimidine kinase [Acidimicrobiales bacterium]|nr:bifunctional hydroxymethylpyrimidine kinase/phosphomethylpyrimidine kinase [Acidimicrobiales bacterium]
MSLLDVMVVGQMARDLVLSVGDVPPPGTSARVKERKEMLGGKGANQAVSFAQLGKSVGLVSIVGDDQVGDWLLDQARRDGIDVTYVHRRPGIASGLVVDVVDDRARWRYLEDLPETVLVTEEDIERATGALSGAAAVVIQLQQPPSAAMLAARTARAAGAMVVLDGSPVDGPERDSLLAAADVVRADAHEAELLAGQAVDSADAAVSAARRLLSLGPRLAALAFPRGNAVVWESGSAVLPLTEVTVADTTGGGDAFLATLATALLHGCDPQQAGLLATAAAGTTVARLGGRPRLSWPVLLEESARLAYPA